MMDEKQNFEPSRKETADRADNEALARLGKKAVLKVSKTSIAFLHYDC